MGGSSAGKSVTERSAMQMNAGYSQVFVEFFIAHGNGILEEKMI